MKQGLLRTFVLAGLSIAFGCAALAQQPRVLGGYKTAPVDDPEVVAAAEFAVGEQASKQETAISLVAIEKAERQVVAGTNFRMCLSVEVDDETSEATVVVFRSLQKEYSLKSWVDGNCSVSEEKQNHALRINGHTGLSAPGIGIGIGFYPASLLTDPEAKFIGARVVHNVTVDRRKGMRVHANFSVRYGLDVPCRMIAYFFEEDGTALEASEDAYTTSQGKVSASTNFTPRYDPAVYNDLQIFIPYAALNMESGDTYDLKFYLALYDKDGGRFFGKSGWYKFRLAMP